MRTVAAEAAARELTMLGVSFRRVAIGAADRGRRTGVRLMAGQALAMANRRSPGLLRVATLARRRTRATVRLMALGTLGMPRDYGVLFGCVARGAVSLGCGVMWQAGVATAAVLVTLELGDGAHLLGMATTAQASVGLGQRELMRLVALRARHRAVKVLIAVRGFMAAAAGDRRFTHVTGGGVGVVTANAAAQRLELRVVRMHALVALRAGFFRAAAHVVRGVTALAGGVCRHRSGGQCVSFSVARAARQRRLLAEVVRLMTTHTLRVAIGKQRSLRHDWLLTSVARLTRGESVDGRGMLMLVTRRADLLGSLTQRGVVGLNVAVAARARPGLGRRVLVNVVAAHAIGSAMHDYGRDGSLRLRVTAHAILRLEIGVRRHSAGGLAQASVDFRRREFVAIAAIRFGCVAEALGRLGGSVTQATLRFMAPRAARRRGRANGVTVQLMALGTG